MTGDGSREALLQPIVSKLTPLELAGPISLQRYFTARLVDGSREAQPFFDEIPDVLLELTMLYKGGGSGSRYPEPSVRWQVAHGSSATLTVTHPAVSVHVPAAEEGPNSKRSLAMRSPEKEPKGTVMEGGRRHSARLPKL